MSRGSGDAGAATLGRPALRGAWTRRTSEYMGDGLTPIAVKGTGPAQKIREGQCDTSGVIAREGARVPHMWEAVLAA